MLAGAPGGIANVISQYRLSPVIMQKNILFKLDFVDHPARFS
jgi:hypothetical protein